MGYLVSTDRRTIICRNDRLCWELKYYPRRTVSESRPWKSHIWGSMTTENVLIWCMHLLDLEKYIFLSFMKSWKRLIVCYQGDSCPSPDVARHALLRYVRILLKRALSLCYDLIYLIIKMTHDRTTDCKSEMVHHTHRHWCLLKTLIAWK
jgi:hypothetical protein